MPQIIAALEVEAARRMLGSCQMDSLIIEFAKDAVETRGSMGQQGLATQSVSIYSVLGVGQHKRIIPGTIVQWATSVLSRSSKGLKLVKVRNMNPMYRVGAISSTTGKSEAYL